MSSGTLADIGSVCESRDEQLTGESLLAHCHAVLVVRGCYLLDRPRRGEPLRNDVRYLPHRLHIALRMLCAPHRSGVQAGSLVARA